MATTIIKCQEGDNWFENILTWDWQIEASRNLFWCCYNLANKIYLMGVCVCVCLINCNYIKIIRFKFKQKTWNEIPYSLNVIAFVKWPESQSDRLKINIVSTKNSTTLTNRMPKEKKSKLLIKLIALWRMKTK